MKTNVIYNKSSVSMPEIDDNSVDTIITSCPYWGLRDYGEGANQIWGGDRDCEHKWNIAPIGGRNKPPGDDDPKFAKGMSNPRGNSLFCQLCGAWYGQLGLEPTLELYLEHLLIITAECKRVLKPTGIMWWNHADCYFTGKGSCINPGGGNKSWKSWNDRKAVYPRGRGAPNRMSKEIPPKCLALQNFRLIIRLIDEQGWVLRNTVQWNKPNSMPSSAKDRLTNKYEPVFFLVKNTKTQYYWNDKTGLMADRKPKVLKEGIDWDWVEIGENYSDSNTKVPKEEAQKLNSPRARTHREKKPKKKSYWHSLDYWFDLDAIRERWTDKRESDIKRAREKHPGYPGKYGLGYNAERREILPGQGIKGQPVGNPDSGKNPGDVWTIPTQPYPEAHFATFPEKLVIKPILSSCPEWICKKCGRARVRIIKKDNPDHIGKTGSEYKTGQNANRLALLRQAARERGEEFVNKTMTIGWTDCGCNAGWRPGITLDLFAGSGTTLAVAKKNGRQFIGYEIVKSYIPLIRKRLAEEDTIFNRNLKEQFQ